MSAGEATVNPDGSTTFETPPMNDTAGEGGGPTMDEETAEEIIKEIDPALYLIAGALVFALLYYFLVHRKSKSSEDDFFSNLDGGKFDLNLPSEVEEYYTIKAKCEEAGWEPGKPPKSGGPATSANATGPHRVLAQALMKRAIADIPIVKHVQEESPGMNKLYAQSMCSVKQWRSFQAAETMVSTEISEVREEADMIEPGWSQVIWRQAMQYHQMLKDRQEQEAKRAEEEAKKQKEIASKKSPEEERRAKELAAEKAAEELIKAEEREKQSKKAFSGKGMKKGFLENNKSSGKKK